MAENSNFTLGGFLPYLLTTAAEESSLEFAKIYKDRYGLLRTEWRVLFHLGQHGGMTATEIAAVSKLHKTKISRAVAGLQKRRYLKRERNMRDRRSEVLTLTKGGESVLSELTTIASAYNRKLLSGFSAHEQAVLVAALKRLSCLGNT